MTEKHEEPFVWAKDTVTGTVGPVAKVLVDECGGRFVVDEKHPVRDSRGDLLSPKFKAFTPQKTGGPSATESGETPTGFKPLNNGGKK